LVFDPAFSGTIKVDGTSYTASSGIVSIPNIAAGSHSITKGSVANLYYIKTQYQSALASKLSQEGIAEPKAVLYPNPAQDVFSISTASDIESIIITNSTGKVMKEIRGNVQRVNISNFESGVYLLLIKTNKGLLQQKIIKK
jgi:pectate lyase